MLATQALVSVCLRESCMGEFCVTLRKKALTGFPGYVLTLSSVSPAHQHADDGESYRMLKGKKIILTIIHCKIERKSPKRK